MKNQQGLLTNRHHTMALFHSNFLKTQFAKEV